MGTGLEEEIERARAELEAASNALDQAVSNAIELASRHDSPEDEALAKAATVMDEAAEMEAAANKRVQTLLALRPK